MNTDIEIIEFFQPMRNDQNLYITNIPANYEENDLYELIYDIFSKFGLIFEIQLKNIVHQDLNFQVCPNKTSEKDVHLQCYAFVKYYSALHAAEAVKNLKNRLFLKGHRIKVNFAKRKNPEKLWYLYYTKCFELANYFIGFNNYSLQILSMNKEENINPYEVIHSAVVRLHFKDGDLKCEGIGIGKCDFTENDPYSKSISMCRSKKRAYQKAVEDAFQKVLIVLLGNGKVFLEINTVIEELVEAALPLNSLLTINELDIDPDDCSEIENKISEIINEDDMDNINQAILEELAD